MVSLSLRGCLRCCVCLRLRLRLRLGLKLVLLAHVMVLLLLVMALRPVASVVLLLREEMLHLQLMLGVV